MVQSKQQKPPFPRLTFQHIAHLHDTHGSGGRGGQAPHHDVADDDVVAPLAGGWMFDPLAQFILGL